MPTDYAIKDGRTVFDATTYTGNGSTQTITNAGSMKPDLVWLKQRSSSPNNTWNLLADSVRGVGKFLSSNQTDSEYSIAQGLTSFNSNGFSLGADPDGSSNTGWNYSGASQIAWQWQAGQGTTSSNTDGSITSTVSVNASAGFSVVSFTCTGVNINGTVGHGLSVAPSLIITKSRGSASNWVVYHSSVVTNVNEFLRLNDTSALTTLSQVWGSTLPTSTVFGIRGDVTLVASATAVAYCWSEIAGFSKFGSYTGNANANGPFVYTGFRPRYVLIKNTANGSADWSVLDTTRDPYNLATKELNPDLSNAESTANTIDFLSNGFKLRSTYGNTNGSGQTMIYAAFAENPFKYANAR